MKLTIATIVEGHGEVEAVPVLLRRIVQHLSPDCILDVPRPIRVKRNKILQSGELERAVALAAHRAKQDGCVLVLLDANGDCPAEVASQILERAGATGRTQNVRAVLAKIEYEAWFLAAAESLAGTRGIDDAVAPPDDPESIRDAKGWLSAQMPPGQPYRETIHQAALSAILDLNSARRAPSFDKLWRDIRSLTQLAGA